MIRVRPTIISTIFSLFISIFLFLFQFLLIYLLIAHYGTQFNGFTRLSTSILAFIGSSDDGLGIMMVLFLLKPLANKDYYRTNDILFTAKKEYQKKFFQTLVIIAVILLLFMIYFSFIAKNSITINGQSSLSLIGIIVIFLSIASKNLFSLLFVAPYENLLRADQNNYVNRLVYLITDLLFYSLLFYLIILNENPIYVFLIFVFYSVVKSILIRVYVKIKYTWIDLKEAEIEERLILNQKGIDLYKMSNLILYSSIIIISALLLGFGSVTFISLYLIVAVAFRDIANSLIYSFKEYFAAVSIKEGRVYWKDFQKFERYVISSASIVFILQFLFLPYIVNVLFGSLINSLNETGNNYELYHNIFTNHTFAIITALQTFIFLLSQPHNIMIFSKKIFNRVAIVSFWISCLSVLFALICGGIVKLIEPNNYALILYFFAGSNVLFMLIQYIYLYYYSWSKLTYNSNFKDLFMNSILIMLSVLYAALPVALYLNVNVKWKLDIINPNGNIYWQNWGNLIHLFLICIIYAISIVALTMFIILPGWFVQLIKESWIGKLFSRKKIRKKVESTDIFLHDGDGVYYKISASANLNKNNEEVLKQVYVLTGKKLS